MRTVLACVRTPLAAESIASCAMRLGVMSVHTAVTESEALARLAERPADVIFADTALTRPDTVGFTRRVLARAPHAILILLGAEEHHAAAAAVAAGARGLVRGSEQDLVGTVTKALLLVGAARQPLGGGGARAARATPLAAPVGPAARSGEAAVTAAAGEPDSSAAAAAPAAGESGRSGVAVVPIQRGDMVDADGDTGTDTGTAPVVGRSSVLTERELQVLRGMAEGSSNAEIGKRLYVSEDTVKTHARRLFRKLGARDRAHAVAVGFRTGLLD